MKNIQEADIQLRDIDYSKWNKNYLDRFYNLNNALYVVY